MESILFLLLLSESKPKWEAVSTFEFCSLLGGLHRNYKVPFKEIGKHFVGLTLCLNEI